MTMTTTFYQWVQCLGRTQILVVMVLVYENFKNKILLHLLISTFSKFFHSRTLTQQTCSHDFCFKCTYIVVVFLTGEHPQLHCNEWGTISLHSCKLFWLMRLLQLLHHNLYYEILRMSFCLPNHISPLLPASQSQSTCHSHHLQVSNSRSSYLVVILPLGLCLHLQFSN